MSAADTLLWRLRSCRRRQQDEQAKNLLISVNYAKYDCCDDNYALISGPKFTHKNTLERVFTLMCTVVSTLNDSKEIQKKESIYFRHITK